MSNTSDYQPDYKISEEAEKLKKQVADAKLEEAAFEAEIKKERQRRHAKTKSLQEQLGAQPKGYSKKQWEQTESDKDIIAMIAGQVNDEWNKSRDAILKTSKYLFEAKLGVKKIHGASWSYLCKEKLPFGVKTADRLVEIGGCEFIHTHYADLPASYTTLYEIAKLDPEVRQQAFDDKKISPDSWRKDITALTETKLPPTPREIDPSVVRTLPIGILNVPVSLFQTEIQNGEKIKTLWLEEKVKLFQAQCVDALKDVMEEYKVDGAPKMIDFSKIDETLWRQAEREQKKAEKDLGSIADQEEKISRIIKKKIKEEVKRQYSWNQMYVGSLEKRKRMNDELFSSNDLKDLIWSLCEVSDPDYAYWQTIETPLITAQSLQNMANEKSVASN